MRRLAVPAGESIRKKLVYMRNNWQLYIFFLLPAVALTFVFKYLPMGGLAIAFEDYNNRLGIFGSEFVGWANFARFLSSPDFLTLMANTLKLSVYGLLWGFFPPIILAIILSRVRGAGLRRNIQLLIYAPNFISVIVMSGMIIAFLSPVGPINQALGTSSNLMTDPKAFRTIYIASGIWQGAGWASIIYTATLSGVSTDLVDACNIDGASLFQQIMNVDIPTLKPIMVIQFILSAGQIMSIGFEKALALQTDLNRAASEIIPTYVYRIGLQIGDYSYSTAVGLFNSVINVILLISVNKIVSHLNEGEGL
ncbi:MAG: ABC transporter permease [Candidatus Onthomonas sp.]